METYNGSSWSTSDLPAPGTSGNFLQSTGTAWNSATTLLVSNGGTGVTTLTTAYGVLAAGTTATGALQNMGTGTTGQVLTSNGPGVLPSFQAASGGQLQTQIFTSPGTWTKPASTTQVRVTVIGAGGGYPGGSAGSSSFGSLVSATGGSGIPNPGAGSGPVGVGTVTTGTVLKTTYVDSNLTNRGRWFSLGAISGILVNETGTTAASTYSTSASWFAGSGGYPATPGYATGGGIAVAICPVSSPVAITVGAGQSNPLGSGGIGGVVVVEFVG
jgi:hypothetical protein